MSDERRLIVPKGARIREASEAQPEPPVDLPPTDEQAARLQELLGHRFADSDLLVRALTHTSWSNEQNRDDSYERLEFLGDAVLGLVSAQWLFHRYPDRSEGRLAKLKSYLVSAPVLADHAESLGVGAMLRLGVGEERSGGRKKRSILADVVEALFGAVYLDAGLDAARPIIERALERGLEARHRIAPADSKTRLQELLQGQGRGLPAYRLAETSGPDHRKTFRVECLLDDEVLGAAEGSSKKTAEQRAAAQALLLLEPVED